MNSVQVLGNLTKDPEVRYTKTGRAVASFTVAVNRTWVTPQGEQRETTDYIPVVAWGNLAEMVGQQLTKGARTFVEGRFQTRSYDAQDGTKRYVTEVVANLVAPNASYGTSAAGAKDGNVGLRPEPKADYTQFGAPAGPSDEEIPF